MEKTEFDVVVIGAGAAGLLGALEIAQTGRSVAIVEATGRIGGRIFTLQKGDRTIELGAEFIHGNLAITQQLLQRAGAKTYAVEGRIWQHKKGQWQEQDDFIEDYEDLEKKFRLIKSDKPVADFLAADLAGEQYSDLRFSLKNYVEGYYAADTRNASTLALCEELTKGDEEQYRIEGGYQVLVNYLEEQCRSSGVQFFINQPVLQVQWKKNAVTAVTEKGSFVAKKALLTVPLGVLQKESILFSPALPQVSRAVQALGFGHVVKPVLEFEELFWNNPLNTGPELKDVLFLFSEEEIPTWWTHHPKQEPVLTGWLGGPRAESYQFSNHMELEQKIIFSLSQLFNLDVIQVQQKLKSWWYHNWSADPNFWGAYSYEVVGGKEAIQFLQQSVEETIFFAGEGLHSGSEIGTVEGALQSGRAAAQRLIAVFSL